MPRNSGSATVVGQGIKEIVAAVVSVVSKIAVHIWYFICLTIFIHRKKKCVGTTYYFRKEGGVLRAAAQAADALAVGMS
jgi:hypothetical protein